MFGKKKAIENRYVIAIKNYTDTVKSIKDGSMQLPYNRDIYIKLIDGGGNRATTIKELGRFIKINRKGKKEVYHFWGGLIDEGYTLLNVQYSEKKPPLEQLCNNTFIRYIGVG